MSFYVSQSKAGVDHDADYRALTRDGEYVWIRDVVHVVRKDGEVEALIGFMFDISERKKTEEHLAPGLHCPDRRRGVRLAIARNTGGQGPAGGAPA